MATKPVSLDNLGRLQHVLMACAIASIFWLSSTALSTETRAQGIISSFTYQPTKIGAVYDRAYIPGGFDSNDSVEVVLEGSFSSSCWRPAETNYKVDQDRMEIFVGPAAYLYPGRLCAQLVLPFDRVVNFGILKAGVYTLIQATNGAVLGEIPVRPAMTNRPDDFMYAPVAQAFFTKNGPHGEVLLGGNFPSSCMVTDEVRVTVEPKVIVLQPIIKLEKRLHCQDGSFPFQMNVIIPDIPQGRYLLHIRSMNAKSINSLIDM